MIRDTWLIYFPMMAFSIRTFLSNFSSKGNGSKTSGVPITPLSLNEPIKDNAIRFVCISDTHGRHTNYKVPIPDGDILLHSGDFTNIGTVGEVKGFNDFLGSLSHPHKVVIAGNHDLSFDKTDCENFLVTRTLNSLKEAGLETAHSLLTNCCYLENSSVNIAGYKIYGSPQSSRFGSWAFMYDNEDAKRLWDMIPEDTTILMTHGPPLGHGDTLYNGNHCGCPELLNVVQTRVRPLFHIFGHIHEDNGMTSDGTTTFINASICNLRYRPENPPYIFDLPMPDGMTKHELHATTLMPGSPQSAKSK